MLAERDMNGSSNPNWKGGRLEKACQQCGFGYEVKRVHAASKFCSMQCVGLSQKSVKRPERSRVMKECEVCESPFSVYASHAHRWKCCSKDCSDARRSRLNYGKGNPNWHGGLSRLPYPWNFRYISRAIIARDGGCCQNPTCSGRDPRMTTHHINYDKQDCRGTNLIALCSSCNSVANFGRPAWTAFYKSILSTRTDVTESFEFLVSNK